MTISLRTAFSDGWADFRQAPGYNIIAAILLTLTQAITFGLLFTPLLVGYYAGLERSRTSGKPPSLDDLFQGFSGPSFINALIGGLLTSLVIFAGLILCLIPGLLLYPLLYIVPQAILRGAVDGPSALKVSLTTLRSELFRYFIYNGFLAIFMVSGGLLCGIGLFLTVPIAYAAHASLARQSQIKI